MGTNVLCWLLEYTRNKFNISFFFCGIAFVFVFNESFSMASKIHFFPLVFFCYENDVTLKICKGYVLVVILHYRYCHWFGLMYKILRFFLFLPSRLYLELRWKYVMRVSTCFTCTIISYHIYSSHVKVIFLAIFALRERIENVIVSF